MKSKKQYLTSKGKPAQDKFTKKVLDIFYQERTAFYNVKQLSRKMDYRGKRNMQRIEELLCTLEMEGHLSQVDPGIFGLAPRKGGKLVTGVVDHVNPRFAFIISDEMEDDIKISIDDLNYAVDGDVVRVSVYGGKTGPRPEGEVVDILSRGRDQFVGRIEFNKTFAFVITDNKKMHSDIFIPIEKIGEAKRGDKVIVKIKKWAKMGAKNPVGEIVQVLGEAGNHFVEMHAILAEFDLPIEFPSQVEKAAEEISDEITPAEIKKRRDLRNVTTFTIDPVDAKDFDDALSMQKLPNGNWEIGVHIADVTHYVKENTILEKEAFARATSVYLVDRVVPMLPEKLSNGLCSLRPNEDKLTFSAIFELDNDAVLQSEWFGRTIIHSDRRFAYEDAQERIETKEGDFAEEINILNDLAYKLRDRRFKNGSIAFETAEVKFKLAEDGTPLEVVPKVRKDAHKLIEDFMLLANKRVAEFIFNKKENNQPKTFVYRVHDNPNTERLTAFNNFAGRFGYSLDFDKLADSFNKIARDIEGKPEENVLQSLAIRAMSKAIYTTDPRGHFGLAFDHYSHFTSPIRRYPDMMAHRLLQHYLNEGKSVDAEEWEDLCKHSSEREKIAAEAERASIKYKQVEFMKGMIGEDFEGVVSGLTDFGIFVEITATKCEGMVRLASLTDDYYEYDADNYRLIGKRNKRILNFGDKVTVRVEKADMQSRTIDLELLEF